MPAEQATPPASMRQYLAALLTLAVVIGFGLWREMAHLQEPALRGSLDDDSAAHDQEEAAVPKGKDAGGVPEDSDLGKALGRLDELLNKHDNFLSDAVAQARRDVDTADAEFPETEEDAGQGERGETHTARLPAPSTAHQWYGKPAARSHGASNLHRRSQHPAATAKESSVQGSASDPEEESSIGAAGLHGGGELDEEEQKEERQYQRRHNHLHDKGYVHHHSTAENPNHVQGYNERQGLGRHAVHSQHGLKMARKLNQCYGTDRVDRASVFGEDGPGLGRLDRARGGTHHRPSLLPHVSQFPGMAFVPSFVRNNLFESAETEKPLSDTARNEAFVSGGFFTLNKRGLASLPSREVMQRQIQQRLGISLVNIAKVQHPNRVSCALVGAAGHLVHGGEKGSGGVKYGKRIDAHDIVIRFNAAPVRGYEAFVGRRTSVRVISSKWGTEYGKGDSFAHARITSLPIEPNVTFIISPGVNSASLPPQRRLAYEKIVDAAKAARRTDVLVLKFSRRTHDRARHLLGGFRECLHRQGFTYDGGDTPSLGLVASLAFKDMCKSVTLFGFGMPPRTRGVHMPYQYYSNLAVMDSAVKADEALSPHSEALMLKAMCMEGMLSVCSWSSRCVIGDSAKDYFQEGHDAATEESKGIFAGLGSALGLGKRASGAMAGFGRVERGGFGADPARVALSKSGIYAPTL